MMLHQFQSEYHNLSKERRYAGVKRLFDELLSDIDGYEDFIAAVLEDAVCCEEDDYFGTEGLEV